jgi:intein/homing endonuclease
MLKYILPKAAVKAVSDVVTALFNRAKARFLGHTYKATEIRIGYLPKPIEHREDLSLGGIFDASAKAEGVAVPNEALKQSCIEIASQYFDAHAEATKAAVLNSVQSFLHDSTTNTSLDPDIVLKEALEEVVTKATANIKMVVDSESTRAKGMGTVDAISRMAAADGIADPVVYFAHPNDEHTCQSCKKIYFMPDQVTPRVWLMSELSSAYYKKGSDTPSICGCHPHCFTGEMMLHTDKGLVSFKDLYDRQEQDVYVAVDNRVKLKKTCGNQYGTPVPGSVRFDRHAKGNRHLKVGSVFKTGERECLRFTLQSGHKIEVSKDHEMWIDDDNSGVKIKARDIKIGDKIPLITGEGRFGLDHFPVEAELMGNCIGDGTLGQTSDVASWAFFGTDLPYGDQLLEKACTLPVGSELKARHKNIGLVKNGGDYVLKNYNVDRTCFNSVKIGRMLVEEFGLSKTPRRVPKRLFQADKETVAAFIRGLYAADGNVNNDTAFVLAQNDKVLLEQIQILLSLFGIKTYICLHESANVKVKYNKKAKTCHIMNCKECYRLIGSGYDACKAFLEEIGFGVPIKNERMKDRLQKAEGKTRLGVWRTSLIVAIEDIGVHETYCATEPTVNTLTVNGIVTGNCRAVMASILQGYGFRQGGILTYIRPDYNIFQDQRGTGPTQDAK